MPDITKGKKVSINGSQDLVKYENFEKFKCAKKRSFKLPSGEYKVVAE